MNWPKIYLKAMLDGRIPADKKILAVYQREVNWMDNPPEDFPFEFNEKLGQHHIDFMQKFCRNSKGKSGKTPIRFELFQLAKMQLVFGWVEKDTGLRRFREVVDIRGRKCGRVRRIR